MEFAELYSVDGRSDDLPDVDLQPTPLPRASR
jgi:hypothetical protein